MAGISRGAREHYFRTKNDLIVATLEHAMSEAVAHARALAEDAGRSADPVAKFLADSGHFFFSRRYRALIEIMVAGRSEPALLRLWNPLVRKARRQLNQIWTDTLAQAGHEPDVARKFIELTHYLMRGVMLAHTWLPYNTDPSAVRDKIPLYTSYTVDNTTLPAIGDEAIGLLRTSSWDPDSSNPVNRRFIADFEAKFGRTPSEYAGHAYDTIMLLDAAVRDVRGKIEDKPALLAALKKANFKSFRGNFRFNSNNFPILDYYLGRVVKDGAKLRIRTVEVVLKDHGDAYADQCPMK
jgi:AcrR family transcriptional regulator